MRTFSLFDSQTFPEALEPKLSLSSFSAVVAPRPAPEPPIPYPVEEPPIEYPLFPPSGPAGPGS